MIWLQDGHLTHSPSGTRLSLFAASMGLRTFLNQAIGGRVARVSSAVCGLQSGGLGAGRGSCSGYELASQTRDRRPMTTLERDSATFAARSTSSPCPSNAAGV